MDSSVGLPAGQETPARLQHTQLLQLQQEKTTGQLQQWKKMTPIILDLVMEQLMTIFTLDQVMKEMTTIILDQAMEQQMTTITLDQVTTIILDQVMEEMTTITLDQVMD